VIDRVLATIGDRDSCCEPDKDGFALWISDQLLATMTTPSGSPRLRLADIRARPARCGEAPVCGWIKRPNGAASGSIS
jgi:hypothetical protein